MKNTRLNLGTCQYSLAGFKENIKYYYSKLFLNMFPLGSTIRVFFNLRLDPSNLLLG